MRAHFKALFMGVLMAASDFSCNFFHILSSGLEQCEKVYVLSTSVALKIYMSVDLFAQKSPVLKWTANCSACGPNAFWPGHCKHNFLCSQIDSGCSTQIKSLNMIWIKINYEMEWGKKGFHMT